MRSLAARIGCGTMSLYSYVKNRDDLLEAILETMVTRSRMPELAATRHESWQAFVRTVCTAYRDLAYAYPRSHELLALAPYDFGPVATHLETLASGLQRAGLSPDRAYQVLGALDAYVAGFMMVSMRSRIGPHTTSPAASAELKRLRDPETFESGLEVFIRGFEEIFSEQEESEKPKPR
jgi:AcrR family transcriptional regulator